MPTQFLPGLSQEKSTIVSKKTTAFMVEFEFPEDLKEETSYSELRGIEGVYACSFYCDPRPDYVISWKGFDWRMTGMRIHVTRRRSREPKYIPVIQTVFIGKTPEKYFQSDRLNPLSS